MKSQPIDFSLVNCGIDSNELFISITDLIVDENSPNSFCWFAGWIKPIQFKWTFGGFFIIIIIFLIEIEENGAHLWLLLDERFARQVVPLATDFFAKRLKMKLFWKWKLPTRKQVCWLQFSQKSPNSNQYSTDIQCVGGTCVCTC